MPRALRSSSVHPRSVRVSAIPGRTHWVRSLWACSDLSRWALRSRRSRSFPENHSTPAVSSCRPARSPPQRRRHHSRPAKCRFLPLSPGHLLPRRRRSFREPLSRLRSQIHLRLHPHRLRSRAPLGHRPPIRSPAARTPQRISRSRRRRPIFSALPGQTPEEELLQNETKRYPQCS